MNECIKLDMDTWNWAELFWEFIGMTTSIYDMTVRMDVTNLINLLQRKRTGLFYQLPYIQYGSMCRLGKVCG